MASGVSNVQAQLQQLSATGQCMICSSMILSTALFIIGCLAAAGHVNGIVLGGCIVGASAPIVLLCIASAILSKGRDRVVSIIMMISELAMVAIGALTITGIISPFVAGLIVVVPTVVILGMGYICAYCCCGCAGAAIASGGLDGSRFQQYA